MDGTRHSGAKKALEKQNIRSDNLKKTKRTPGALRQKARVLGIPLGHRR